MSASAFAPGLQEWARKRASRLADEFMAGDACERAEAGAFLAAYYSREPLLAALRDTAEAAFMARVLELEAAS